MDQLHRFLRVSVSDIFNLKIPRANKGLRTLPVGPGGPGVDGSLSNWTGSLARLLQHLTSEGEQNHNAFAAPQIS